MTIVMATAFNFIVVLALRGRLVAARSEGDVSTALTIYGLWFLFFSVGFYVVSNTFVKRWAGILGEKNLGSFLKFVLRVSLLSPVLSYAVSVITLLYFPGSPFQSVARGGSKIAILIFSMFCLMGAVVAVPQIPKNLFGLERTEFEKASAKFEVKLPFAAQLPDDVTTSTFLAVASPALRYLSWLAIDFFRAQAITDAVSKNPNQVCYERLGYVGVEVDDCFFRNFRSSSEIAPMVSPYFGLYFETKYRQQTTKDRTPGGNLALNLLMLSNLLELVEPGPSFVDRRHLLKPAPLLFGFGSPEVPLVELGQDFQRMMLIKRMLPLFDLQLSTAKDFLSQEGSSSVLQSEGIDVTAVESELRDLEIRIAAVRRDPLGIAHFFLGLGVGGGGDLGGSMNAGSPEKE